MKSVMPFHFLIIPGRDVAGEVLKRGRMSRNGNQGRR
jgi:hypothetical protein